MIEVSCLIYRSLVFVSVIFYFSVHIEAQTVIGGNFRVTGNTTLDKDLVAKGASTARGNLTLQKSSGTSTPFLDIKESGGLLKGRIFGNTTTGQAGLNFTTVGTNPIIAIESDGTITLNDSTTINGDATINGVLVVTGDAQFASLNKGDLSITTTYTYTLGDIIDFDQINDDPGSNVSGSPAAYVVPVPGYYLVTVGLTGDSLTISEVTLSSPVCQLEIVKNDRVVFKAYQPIVTLGSQNHHEIATIIRAEAGDSIYASYTAWAIKMDSSFGSVAGTIDLLGDSNGIANFMKVHYLSTAVEGGGGPL